MSVRRTLNQHSLEVGSQRTLAAIDNSESLDYMKLGNNAGAGTQSASSLSLAGTPNRNITKPKLSPIENDPAANGLHARTPL